MTRDKILKGIVIWCALAVVLCLYSLSRSIAVRNPWWLVAGGVLALCNGSLVTYTLYRQLRGKQIIENPVLVRVTSLLTWGTILLVFVPLFAPRVWAYLRQ
jgi:hypothetical protein